MDRVRKYKMYLSIYWFMETFISVFFLNFNGNKHAYGAFGMMSYLGLLYILDRFGHHAATCSRTVEFHFQCAVFVASVHRFIILYWDPLYNIEKAVIDGALVQLIIWYFKAPKKQLPPSALTSRFINEDATQQTCSICLEDQCDYIIPSCEHVYHRRCLEEWLVQKDGTCCICKQEIKSIL